MLPGFRFLLAAILLSTSVLVFGLGAAALLRASHEQYVSRPSWRNGPQEQVFAQPSEPAQPVLALLRAEPEAAEPSPPSLRDQVPTIGLPASEPEQVAAVTSEAAPPPRLTETAPPAAEPAKAEIKAEAETKAETEIKAEPETKPETTAEAATPTDTLIPADATASVPEARPAVSASAPAPDNPTPTLASPALASPALASPARDSASVKLAVLNEPATTARKDPPAKAKANASTPDSKAVKRKAKPKKRHRIVRRPPPQQLQQQLDPFGQPQQPAFATTTARTAR